jgi:hypothetical protein
MHAHDLVEPKLYWKLIKHGIPDFYKDMRQLVLQAFLQNVQNLARVLIGEHMERRGELFVAAEQIAKMHSHFFNGKSDFHFVDVNGFLEWW